jgi:hypothetical protein
MNSAVRTIRLWILWCGQCSWAALVFGGTSRSCAQHTAQNSILSSACHTFRLVYRLITAQLAIRSCSPFIFLFDAEEYQPALFFTHVTSKRPTSSLFLLSGPVRRVLSTDFSLSLAVKAMRIGPGNRCHYSSTTCLQIKSPALLSTTTSVTILGLWTRQKLLVLWTI